MAPFAKTLKKYERHFLLALVIILLLTFSIGGAIQCDNQPGAQEIDYGGTYLVDPTSREDLDSNEFVTWLRRLDSYRQTVRVPSLRYDAILQRAPADERMRAAWSHILPSEAGREAGYSCGEEFQLKAAVRQAVDSVMRGMAFNDATYDQFIREYYRRPAKDFEQTIREVVMKDSFVQPLIETRRFETSYEQAYEVWKNLVERVDLDYVALRGEDFNRAALEQERTRDRIGAQRGLLDDVSRTARDLDILDMRVKGWRDGHDGAAPETLEDLADFRRSDAWDNEFRYEKTADGYDLRSAGPDGAFESSDDVTTATISQLKTRAALREVGAALLRWHEATKAWPESLEAMREAPVEGALAPLTGSADDGWGAGLVYAPTEGAAPRLFSKGPDGEADTADDLAAVVSENGALVTAGRELVAYLLEEDKDIWDRPLRIDLAHALTWGWEVSSAGRDGEFGNDDDLATGNHRELEDFYQQPDVKIEFEVPEKKDFEAVYLHLPLIPDEALGWLLETYAQHRPDEEEAYNRWRQLHEYSYYMAENPADGENGHGAEHARTVAPDLTAILVPASTVFGEPPEGFVSGDDPDRAAYLEKGWRPIVLREQFLEGVMNDLLGKVRKSQDALRTWDEAKALFDAGEGEDPGEQPKAVTFRDLLDGELKDFLPKAGDAPWIAYVRTESPLARAEIEELAHIGDINLTLALQQMKGDGDYAATPAILNDSHTKALLRLVKNHERHDRPLEEIRDQIFDRFVESKRLDLAAKALEGLRADVEEAERKASVDAEGELDRGAIWATTIDRWSAALELPSVVETTGAFIGAKPPLAKEMGEDADEEEQALQERRDFVRATGYDALRAGIGADEQLEAGALGSSILRDDLSGGSDSVFLVRLKSVTVPPRATFSPRAYADYLSSEILGGTRGGRRLGASSGSAPLTGSLFEGLRSYYYDFPWLKGKFDLQSAFDPEKVTRE